MTTATNAIGTVQEFKKKPKAVQAIQFTGKNAKAVAEWVREMGYTAKAGGSYVDISDDRAFRQRLTKGMIVAALSEGHIHVYHEAEFRADFTISKKNALI